MVIYGIGLTALLNSLVWSHFEKNTRLVAFADDLTYAHSTVKIRGWWKKYLETGPTFRCFPDSTKTVLLRKIPKFYLIYGKAQFPQSRPKLCGNRVFPQNFHTRKLGKNNDIFMPCINGKNYKLFLIINYKL